MDKVTKFLEAYVQWIVLGLCVLFLGFLTYSYWVAPRSVVKINGKDMQPDEINQAIIDGPVKRIESETQKDAPAITVKDHNATFIAMSNFTDPTLQAIYKPLPPAYFGGNPRDVKATDGATDDAVATYKATAAPQLPAPQDGDSSTGRTLVRVVDKEALLAANVQGGAAPAAVPDKPATPKKKPGDAAGGAAGAAPAGKTKDIDWVTFAASIPMSDLQDAWNSAFKPAGDDPAPAELFDTRILKVELRRQEKLNDGTWSKDETIVPPLEMYKMRPLPKADAELQASYDFEDWAKNHAEFIATPAFYEAEKGKPWHEPGTDAPGGPNVSAPVAAPPPNTPFDPAHPPKKMSPEQKKMVAEYKKAQKQMKSGPGGLPGGYPGMLPGAPRPGKAKPYYQPAPPAKSKAGATPRQPSGYPMPPGGMMPPGYGRSPYPGMMPPGYGRSPYPGMMPPGYGRTPYPGMPGGQPGAFNPRPGAAPGAADINIQNLSDDVKIWAHDETVQPGKTYRYRIRYYMQNPLFGTGPNIVSDSKLKQLLWLESPFTEWSEPVHVSERVNFWLAKMTGTAASFEVFEWKNDGWTGHMRPVTPGDQIPGTSWTLADMRKDVKGQYVLIVNEAGIVERRDLKTDQESSEYQEMKDEAAAPKAPAQ